jgi:hypothetical protein
MSESFSLDEVLHGRSLVIASNRGPITFTETDDGEPARVARSEEPSEERCHRAQNGCGANSAFTSKICVGPIGVNVLPLRRPICTR